MVDEGYFKVVLTGPKGIGKSVTTAVLFLLMQSITPCLYLTQDSFKYPKYFEMFVHNHIKGHCSDSEDRCLKVLSDLSARGVEVVTIQEIITLAVGTGKEVFAFLDFGTIRGSAGDGKYFKGLMDIVRTYCPIQFTKVVCISSGFRMGKLNSRFSYHLQQICRDLENFVDGSFCELVLTGYTEIEAENAIRASRTSIHIDDVKKIGGTNPLLLSKLNDVSQLANFTEAMCKHQSVVSKLQFQNPLSEYSHRVQNEVKFFLAHNLSVISDATSFKELLQFHQWETGRHYILLTLQCREFTDTDIINYKSTWLCQNHILIPLSGNRFKFNFPGLGEILIEAMRDLLPTIPNIQHLAIDNHSVAGLVYEQIFIHFIKRQGKLEVICSSLVGEKDVVCYNFSSSTVLRFCGRPLLDDVLYDLYTAHPAIDFVGYLKSHLGPRYLVFIQMSLSTYQQHKSHFDDIIRTVPKNELLEKDDVHTNLLQYYSKRIQNVRDGKANVLLLYISPRESQDLIDTLRHQLKSALGQYSVAFTFYVGVATENVINSIFRGTL